MNVAADAMRRILTREQQWDAYQQSLRAYWEGHGPRPGKTLDLVERIEDLDPRQQQQTDFAANGWSTRR